MLRKSLITLMQFRPFGRSGNRRLKKSRQLEGGVTLIETMVASLLLMIVVAGLLPVFTMGLRSTEQQGDVATRTTEYADDKMESLVNLLFTDGQTDTTVFPAGNAGGTGLGGAMAGNATVGSVAPAAAVAGYVDYLDFNGNLLASATGADYVRQWSITADATATLKTIAVSATSLKAGGAMGVTPSTTVVCVKSSGL